MFGEHFQIIQITFGDVFIAGHIFGQISFLDFSGLKSFPKSFSYGKRFAENLVDNGETKPIRKIKGKNFSINI